MRRLLALALVALAALSPSACTGADGARAQELLAEAQTALEEVRSLRFSARIWMEAGEGAPAFTVRLQGGGYAKGKRAGEFVLNATVDGVPADGSFSLVSRGGTVFANVGGQWASLPAPPVEEQAANPLAGFDLTRYVTDVRVDEGADVGGEPAVKLTGVIDTSALLEGLLEQMGGLSELGAAPVPGLSDQLGDTRVVLWVSEVRSLPLRGLVDLVVEDVSGEPIELHVDFALSGFDERVRIPNPA